MSTSGQTINDRLNAAKYTLAGQALARCICKATTEELMRPKKKHLDYLAACTYQPNVSIQQLITMLIERTNHSNWVVVYKALISVHHLMRYGHERFTQYLASSNYSFQLNNFLDRIVAKGYAMSSFIRRYSSYINQRALSYRTLAVDLCRSKKKLEESILRKMPIERLLETLPVIHKQLDTLLEFGCTADELNNSIITASFTLLFHDAIRLFACYNDGIINLFEKYFDLNKKMCREAFEAYKKFLACTDRVAEFLKVAEAINLNNGDLPDFKRAPSSLLDAFEQHLISLESNRKRPDAQRLEVDTKLAAFPQFSVNNDFDSSPSPRRSPTFEEVSKDFESQLAFSTVDDDDFTVKIAEEKPSPHQPISLTAPMTSSASVASIFDRDDSGISSIFKSSLDEPQTTITDQNVAPAAAATSNLAALSKSPFDDELFVNTISAPAQSNPFDASPPGFFSDGSLLTPEASVNIQIDPSIDPRTQQQLIQIRREQVANRYNSGSGNSNNNNSMNSANSQRAAQKPVKTSKESMFEDLENTMRQSLLKSEKA